MSWHDNRSAVNEEYQWISVNISEYQWISVNISEYQWMIECGGFMVQIYGGREYDSRDQSSCNFKMF